MPEQGIRDKVRAYLTRLARGVPFGDGDDVFGAGVVKSINVLELINYLEDTWGTRITQRDVFAGRLRSVDSIVGLLVRSAA